MSHYVALEDNEDTSLSQPIVVENSNSTQAFNTSINSNSQQQAQPISRLSIILDEITDNKSSYENKQISNSVQAVSPNINPVNNVVNQMSATKPNYDNKNMPIHPPSYEESHDHEVHVPDSHKNLQHNNSTQPSIQPVHVPQQLHNWNLARLSSINSMSTPQQPQKIICGFCRNYIMILPNSGYAVACPICRQVLQNPFQRTMYNL